MEKGIPYNGFNAVIDMLRRADSAFRDKLLNNIRKRDPQLCRRLEAALGKGSSPRDDNSRAALERSQRAAFTRNYGN